MSHDVVVEKKNWEPGVFTYLLVVLVCIIYGYSLPSVPEDMQKPIESVIIEKLKQARPGDYAITTNGDVLLLSGRSMGLTGLDEEYIHYSTHFTLEEYTEKKSLSSVARITRDVVSSESKNYATVSRCFSKGKSVKSMGTDKWVCPK